MTVNFEDLSVAQLIELKQKCETLLNKRHTDEIKKALYKLYSAMEDLADLDPDASVLDGYDWYELKDQIQDTYIY